MLKKGYVEITNLCNLRCAFCPGTLRPPRTMTPREFSTVLDRLSPHVEYVFLHVMGEPLLHPRLPELLACAEGHGARLCLTTNGTLLARQGEALLGSKALYRVAVSLHSVEGNGGDPARAGQYLEEAWSFARRAAERGVICALRLWNEGGAERGNEAILRFLREKTGAETWPEPRPRSFRLGKNLYLEREAAFTWPDPSAAEAPVQFCRALREQIAVLADGTVVPCCLDREGALALGNLFENTLPELLDSPRASAMREGFSRRVPVEPLCRRCGYALRFNK